LKDKYLCWPTEEERWEPSSRIKVLYFIPNRVGIIDGTLIFLDEAPLHDAVPYFSRKTRYALSLLVFVMTKGGVFTSMVLGQVQPMIIGLGESVR